MFESGYIPLGRFRGAPIRIHWAAAVGALIFSGFRFEPGAWAGFFLLILCHELGHASLVMRYRLRVVSVDLHAYGGVCRWAGDATPWERSVIAWGGVLAQLLLLGATFLVLALVGLPRSRFLLDLADVFFWTNLWLIGINLLPIPPLDGVNAWKIFGTWRTRRASVPFTGSYRDPHDVRPEPPAPRQPQLSREDVERLNRLFENANRKG